MKDKGYVITEGGDVSRHYGFVCLINTGDSYIVTPRHYQATRFSSIKAAKKCCKDFELIMPQIFKLL